MLYIIKRNKVKLGVSFLLFLLSIGILYYLMTCTYINVLGFFILILLFCCFLSKALYTFNMVFSRIQGNEKNYTLIPFLNISNTILEKDFDISKWKIFKKNKIGFYFYSRDIKEIKHLPIIVDFNFRYKNDFLYRLTMLSQYYFLFIKKNYLDGRNFYEYLRQRRERKTYALISNFENELILVCVDIRDAILDQKILGRELFLDSLPINSSQALLAKRKERYILKSPEKKYYISGIQINMLFITSEDMVVLFDSVSSCFYSYTDVDEFDTLNTFCQVQVKRHLGTDNIEVDFCGVSLSCEDVGAPILICKVFLTTQFFSMFNEERVEFISFKDFLKLDAVDEKKLMLQHILQNNF